MNILKYVLIIALSLRISFIQTQNISFLQRQYEHFVNNLRVVKKCYLQRSIPCTKEEQKKANTAIGKGLALVTVVYGITVGYRYWRLLHAQNQHEKVLNNISFITPVNWVEKRGSDIIVDVMDVTDAARYKDTIANVIRFEFPAAKRLIIQEIPLWQQLLIGSTGGSKLIIPLGKGDGKVGEAPVVQRTTGGTALLEHQNQKKMGSAFKAEYEQLRKMINNTLSGIVKDMSITYEKDMVGPTITVVTSRSYPSNDKEESTILNIIIPDLQKIAANIPNIQQGELKFTHYDYPQPLRTFGGYVSKGYLLGLYPSYK